ncbi:beta-channel forming cytolysin [Clostridium botulinum]|uniref:Alpha hemolysin n=1 Tax=Clostridium botulinum C/D str. DC5 TaxID=1443128 RepID=A0A0A0ID13_CLOBO|nr:beta-channel forming cytolysin [Clostridium botulinum]KEI01942.1 alpha hemolysin [Clostridium botulinum C/D str. BKT75002]KEI10044.1 alpha hemolysin [Clostridium botulinum C/D str. BKT2873]KGM97490.1 alpha hemolysin [Clostridium botulinum C/D str. DC5]KGM98201.1 alpha hemolysin [Clostridium botulinum D str. CCUG 7971]KOC50410.1 alpha hemolysin [Clostridium botulinum]
MLYLKKIGSVIITSLLLSLCTNLSSISANAAESKKEAQSYTATDVVTSPKGNIKSTLSVTFVEDPFDSQFTALVSTEGSFIPSGFIKKTSDYYAEMLWPAVYDTLIESKSKRNSVKITKSIPTNQIKAPTVSETMGYSIGGNISLEKSSQGEAKTSAGISGSYNFSRSVNYDQPEYNTLLKNTTSNSAHWQVEYNANNGGYNRDSYNSLYGNELFMKSRLYNYGDKNLTDYNDLPSLITGGFSPKVVVALKAPKNTKTSVITVYYTRFNDKYDLDWDCIQWFGRNLKLFNETKFRSDFELDWKKHTVKYLR